MNKKTIAITGVTGFVGQNLSAFLQGDFEIVWVSRKLSNSNASFEQLCRNELEYDALIHLAGKAHDLKNTTDEEEYFKVNYELTKQLYDAFLKSDARTFVFMSSVKAAADTLEEDLDEEYPANPLTGYGKSKRMAEQYILENLPANKQVYILRPCIIHGPGNKGNLNLLYKLVSKNIPWPLAAFENKRSFCSIENIMFVIRELIEREDIASGIYQVADETPVSTNELIKLIAEARGKSPKLLYLSKNFIRNLAKIGDYLKLPFNSERLKKLTENYTVSNKKIVLALGKEMPVAACDGLIRTFNSFNRP
jgi:nucleoside-diphosphate-sugar epimerase